MIRKFGSLTEDPTLAVVGAVGGDEGKGKVTDTFAEDYDIVDRFSGASNTGATTYTPDGQQIVAHLIPVGGGKGRPCVISRGVSVDLVRLIDERDQRNNVLRAKSPPPILLDYGCTVWTPYLSFWEAWCEDLRGDSKIGTTGRGVGPMAAMRALRADLKVEDLALGFSDFRSKVQHQYELLAPILKSLRRRRLWRNRQWLRIPKPADVAGELWLLRDEILPHMEDTRQYLYDAYVRERRILFEATQAAMLDLFWGTYHNVSSGMATASGVSLGTGLPFNALKAVCMVSKLFPTRVGVGGPLPSEFWHRLKAEDFARKHPGYFRNGLERAVFLAKLLARINQGSTLPEDWAQYIQVLGYERGASTGRGRSPGATDFQWLRYAIQLNAPKFLALTRFDMGSGLKRIPVVTGYELDGKSVLPRHMPSPRNLERVKIITEWWPGWMEDISGVRSQEDLPSAAREFIERYEQHVGVHVGFIGTGPGPHDHIVRI